MLHIHTCIIIKNLIADQVTKDKTKQNSEPVTHQVNL